MNTLGTFVISPQAFDVLTPNSRSVLLKLSQMLSSITAGLATKLGSDELLRLPEYHREIGMAMGMWTRVSTSADRMRFSGVVCWVFPTCVGLVTLRWTLIRFDQ
jgi:hypothetical protein